MRKFFYYFRDKDNRPVVSVCLIRGDGGVITRGVAICSPKDQPEKKVGRNIAMKRAFMARHIPIMASESPVLRDEATKVLSGVPNINSWRKQDQYILSQKMWSYPELTEFEQSILGEAS